MNDSIVYTAADQNQTDVVDLLHAARHSPGRLHVNLQRGDGGGEEWRRDVEGERRSSLSSPISTHSRPAHLELHQWWIGWAAGQCFDGHVMSHLQEISFIIFPAFYVLTGTFDLGH
jgi:hypothetical protein